MDEIIYLDNGATSFPKPEEVYVFMDQFYRNFGVNPGRAAYGLSIEAEAVVSNTRQLLTSVFNGQDPNRLCFSYNSTDALNLIIFGLLQPGDHAISTALDHNSVLRPLYLLSLQGVEVEYVPFDKNGFIDPDEIKRRFRANTRLVVVSHASNVIGTVQPIAEIGRRCREAGVIFAVDSSQTAGKIPVDMDAQFIDVVAFTGHKSLLGPTGIGGLYVREGVEIRQTRAGGTGIKSCIRTHPEEYPYRLEYGTVNTIGIAGLYRGVRWILERGMQNIHEHEMRLTRKLRDGLKEIPGVILYCQDDLADHIGVLAFNIQGLEAGKVGKILDSDYGIAVRSGFHCSPLVHKQLDTVSIGGAVRFGIGPFNTEEQIDTAVKAVAVIASGKKKSE